jgi:hypothetical protein
MSQTEQQKVTMAGTDILFECRECGKSLSIDCRGAGLNIRCPQCDTELEVPIPEGFDLAEIDKDIATATVIEEEIKSGPVETAEAEPPAAGAEPNGALRKDLETLRAQNQYLIQQYNDVLKTVQDAQLQVHEFHEALDKLSATLDSLTDSQAGETQEPA